MSSDKMVINAKVLEDLKLFIQAVDAVVFVNCEEEGRVMDHIQLAAEQVKQGGKREVVMWSVTRGLWSSTKDYGEEYRDPQAALQYLVQAQRADAAPARVYVFFDLHPYLEQDPVTRRLLKDVAKEFNTCYSRLFCVSAKHQVPVDMLADVRMYSIAKPTYDELHQLLTKRCVPEIKGQCEVDDAPEFLHKVVRTLQGLTLTEAEQAAARAVVRHHKLSEEILPSLLEEKKGIINRSDVLEFYPANATSGSIGGYALLKKWIRARGKAYGEKAQQFGCPPPKGVALLGVQGCGKSLAAKVISYEWQMPALRMDMSRLMNSLLGASEANLEKCLQTAAALAPCVLFIDEMEKAFGGAGSGNLDGGTSGRMLGRILTWMQERTEPVFIIATANSIEGLPPELLRKGRFDEIFFIDLPSAEERDEIFRIHITKVGRDPGKFKLDELVESSEGFSGAEIEAAVTSALFTVFDKYEGEKDITTKSLLRELQATTPLSETMKERIQHLRTWAASRTRSASKSKEELAQRRGSAKRGPRISLSRSCGGEE